MIVEMHSKILFNKEKTKSKVFFSLKHLTRREKTRKGNINILLDFNGYCWPLSGYFDY